MVSSSICKRLRRAWWFPSCIGAPIDGAEQMSRVGAADGHGQNVVVAVGYRDLPARAQNPEPPRCLLDDWRIAAHGMPPRIREGQGAANAGRPGKVTSTEQFVNLPD